MSLHAPHQALRHLAHFARPEMAEPFPGELAVLLAPGGREVFAEPREASGAFGHRVVREGGEVRALQAFADGTWKDLYAFTLEPHYAVDYEVASSGAKTSCAWCSRGASPEIERTAK